MGAVYKASDLGSTRVWAIKEMSDSFATDDERAEAIRGFEQEARLLSELDHPNLPRITHFFSDHGHQYLVMDLVEGENWEKKLSRQRPSIAEVLDIVMQLVDVLEYLHNRPQPIIFRDLKPANVMITPAGVAKLIDFGIARVFQAGKATDTRALGTPGYAAPEQYGTGQSDARTDIYALGVMMHQAFTGVDPSLEPFKFAPIPTLVPLFPVDIDRIVAKATAVNRQDRYDSVASMRNDLIALREKSETYAVLPARLRTGILPPPVSTGFRPAVVDLGRVEINTIAQGKTILKGENRGELTSSEAWLRAEPSYVDGRDVTVAAVVDATGLVAGQAYTGTIASGKDSLQVRFEVVRAALSCWTIGVMVLLLLTAIFVPVFGFGIVPVAWVLAFVLPGPRKPLVLFAVAITLCSLISSLFGIVLFQTGWEFLYPYLQRWGILESAPVTVPDPTPLM